jgi:hypothetical protein
VIPKVGTGFQRRLRARDKATSKNRPFLLVFCGLRTCHETA